MYKRQGERDAEPGVELVQLVGGVPAVLADAEVHREVRVDLRAAAPEGDVEQPDVALALVVLREFAVDLQALLAQPAPGAAEFDFGALLVQAEQSGGYRERLGLDLDVPEQGAGRLGQLLERPGEQTPFGHRQQPGGGPVALSGRRAQIGVEHVLPPVGHPFRGDPADGDEDLGAPGGARSGLPQGFTEEPGECGRGEHSGVVRSVGAQPRIGEGRFPVPVQQFADGLQRGRRPRPLLQLGAELLVGHFEVVSGTRGIRGTGVLHGCIPPGETRNSVHTGGYATPSTGRQSPPVRLMASRTSAWGQLF